MKKIFSIILIAACGLFAYSCTNEADTDFSGRMTVSLNTSDLLPTRASTDDPFNENLIKSIDFFLYKGNDTTAAFQHGHLSTEAIHSKSFIIDFKLSDYNTLFAGSDNAVMYAVVNMPENTALSGTGIDDVRAATLTADFATDSIMGWFVMSGRTVFPKNATEITVEVERVAAKLSLGITTAEYCLEDEADEHSTKWYSHPEAIKVEFVNTFSKAVVSGKIDAYTATDETVATVPESKPHTYYYTYPRQWEFGSDFEPYFFITMPVTKDSFEGDGSPTKYCYYKVVLPGKQFERNHWYAYTIRLKMLGSFERETPTVDTPDNVNFFVYKWGGYTGSLGNQTSGQIEGIRFLEVSENSSDKVYYMYNQNKLEIPYSSSDNCTIVNFHAESENFMTGGMNNRTSDVSVTLNDKVITVNHVLQNNTRQPNYDYAPIHITFTVQHDTGNPSVDALYTENITIVQYPAMYIMADENDRVNDKGGVFVNGNNTTEASYGGVRGLVGTNRNPNMYVIVSSVLSSDTDMLGDPRALTADNLGITTSLRPIESGSNRMMTNYFPVLADGSADNYIAPKFRIASSYGVMTEKISYNNAMKRCATYQEDGYPAGRWRMPTKAEIKYINKLSADGVFPSLFNSGTGYWCVRGYCTDGTVSNTTSGNNYVRCVYDEWYWENTAYPRIPEGQRTIAMWGDAAR